MMMMYGVKTKDGKWLSRGRFDASWSGVLELDHVEFFDSQATANDLAKRYKAEAVAFTVDELKADSPTT